MDCTGREKGQAAVSRLVSRSLYFIELPDDFDWTSMIQTQDLGRLPADRVAASHTTHLMRQASEGTALVSMAPQRPASETMDMPAAFRAPMDAATATQQGTLVRVSMQDLGAHLTRTGRARLAVALQSLPCA